MKRLAVGILLFSSVAFGANRSLAAGSGTVTLGVGAPYNNVGSWHTQFRLHGAWTYSSTQTIRGTNDYLIRILGGAIVLTSWRDGPGSAVCNVFPPAGSDIIVRFQRQTSGMSGEYFNTATGVDTSYACSNGTPGSPNDSGSTLNIGALAAGSIAYIRDYTGVVPVGTPPNNVTGSGTEFSYEFENNGLDTSGFAANLTMSGASYTDTPIFNPVSGFNVWPALNVFQAARTTFGLSSTSYTSTDNATLSYLWQQLTGPIRGVFTSRTTASSSFGASLAGQYTVQLSVCDSTGNCATPLTQSAGAAATDSKGITLTGLGVTSDNILGPGLVADGVTNQYPYADLAEIGTANNLALSAFAATPVLGSQLSGTVGWTQGTPVLNTTSDLRASLSGQTYVVVAWTTVDGAGTGRFLCPISSVTVNTVVCLANLFQPTESGVPAYLAPPVDAHGCPITCWVASNPATVWNYYDVALGLYRLYWRTRKAIYLTWAQSIADTNWSWVLDHGYPSTFPRVASVLSSFYRALEGHSERLPALSQAVTTLFSSFGDPTFCPYCDLRETGYSLWYVAMGTKVDPDPTRHAAYCAILTTNVPIWNARQSPDGSWGEDDYSINPTFVAAPLSFTPPGGVFQFQSSGWRVSINAKSLEASYEVLADTTSAGCNQPTIAAATLTAIGKFVVWANTVARDPVNRGTFYEVNSQSADQSTVYHPDGAATISGTIGSPTVNGVGTHWLTKGYCGGTWFLGIETAAPRRVYKINNCVSDTQLTLTTNYGIYGGESNFSGIPYSVAPSATHPCPSAATYCFGANGDRNLTRTLCGSFAWLYAHTGNSTYSGYANECYSATLGGPTAGPTSAANILQFGLPCSGAGCDGFIGDSIAALLDCNVPNPAPCTAGGNVYSNLGKNFGETWGAPGIGNTLPWTLGGPDPPAVKNQSLSFFLPTNATQARFTSQLPDGTSANTTCTTSPCVVPVDVREGAHVVSLAYLNVSNVVLASFPFPVTVKVQ